MIQGAWLALATMVAIGACASEEPELGQTEQAIVRPCTKIGLYDKTQSQPWNPRGVTVHDVRQCNSDGTTSDAYLTGLFVADQVGFVEPGFPDPNNHHDDHLDGTYRVFFPDAMHSNGKLLIYLPGSGEAASVADKEELLQRAAYDGYHVLAIRYWNTDDSEVTHCGNNTADDGSPDVPYTRITPLTFDTCVIRSYLRRFTNFTEPYPPALVGPKHTPCYDGAPYKCHGTREGRAIGDGDAVLFRVRALLRYLANHRPASEAWDSFKAPNTSSYQTPPYLDWRRVALMGHSTGSKVLFHVAHDGPAGVANANDDVLFDRVIFLSGPNLSNTTAEKNLDSYVHSPGKTPLDRIYAFSDTHDPNVAKARETWASMSGPATAGDQTGAVTGLTPRAPQPSGLEEYQTSRICIGTAEQCHNCFELHPLPPDGNERRFRALTYDGDVGLCTSTGVDPHVSTTSDKSCRDPNNPDTCWYRKIWDFMLLNPTIDPP